MDVTELLEKHTKDLEKFKPITVEKHLDVEYDVGTLLVIDKNDLDKKSLNTEKEVYLKNLSRDNTQLLFNQIWQLPNQRVDEAIVAKLPPPTFFLPRAKHVPKPKPLTKWQQFAKEKGIDKKKKSKLSWDDQLGKWVPLYGFKRAAAQKEKDWLLEVPQNADPLEDQFTKKTNEKIERVSKNELQRLRNLAKSKNVKVPRLGVTAIDKSSAKDLSAALTIAKASTASIGKFQSKLPKEKEARGIGALVPGSSRKRKPPPVPSKVERSENLAMIDSILNKQPKLDIDKAVSRHINQEQIERSEEKHTGKPKAGRGGKKKGRGSNKGAPKGRGMGKPGAKPSGGKRPGAKPAGGKGQRNPNKKAVGRKRR